VPVIRQQPDFTAPDGTNTTFFFSDSNRDDDDGDGVFETREVGEFPNFFGTSAAAPHAAAVAALLLQADPTLTPDGVYKIMEDSAQNIGRKRVDFESGWGMINAYTALRRTVGGGR
jgi:subtilisin family serine protease